MLSVSGCMEKGHATTGPSPLPAPAGNNTDTSYVDKHRRVRIDTTAKEINEVKFTEVYAYSFNVEGRASEYPIISNGYLEGSAKRPGKKLSEKQVKKLLTAISDTNFFGGGTAACFEPRMGLVFVGADKKVTGHISICFECNRLESTPVIAAQEYYSRYFGSAYLFGLSRSGRKHLMNLCSDLGLERCGDDPGLFDK